MTHILSIRFITKISLAIILIFAVSCARKGSPSGGPKDIKPPMLVKAYPDTFSTNVSTDIKKIEIDFDEYIVLKDAMKSIVVSPPIDPQPIFSPSGIASKTVKVEFTEPLLPETTYTINFGKSIRDNNEGNAYPYFTYVFSTGEFIDSLEINGAVRHPGERKMPENVVAALYKMDEDYKDSLIYTQKPYYVAKLDSANHFKLNYLHEGQYKLVAFNDETPNMQFDVRNEKIAFHPEPISAGSEQEFELNLFEPVKDYRAVEVVQAEYGKLNFIFEGKPEKVEIVPLNHTFTTQIIEHKPFSDTLTYYFNPGKDTIMEKRTRLRFAVNHLGKSDTIPPVMYDNEKYKALSVYGRNLDYAPEMSYQIEANYPLETLDKNYISVKRDTLDLDFEVERLKRNRFALKFPIAFDSNYKIQLLPNAAMDFMQRTNDTINLNFGVKNQREYGNLILNLQNAPDNPYWLKLFDSQDKELKSVYGQEKKFEFKALKPGDYYFKLIVDENANQRYDTGNLFENKQPEKIYIYPANVTVRAFWDVEETWVLGSNKVLNPEEVAPKKKSLDELQPTKPLQ